MLSLTQLRYFIEIANTLNLSRSAEKLGISQPSLSVAIKKLETALGARVFIRQKRGVHLTQAGKQLLAHSKQLLQYWEGTKAKVLASHNEIQGSFILGCHPSLGLHYLANFLPDLLIKHPRLEIQIQHDISRRITEKVINLSVDLGVVVNPIKHPDLILHKLGDDKVTLWQSSKNKNENQMIHSEKVVFICDPELGQTQWLLKNLNKKGIHTRRILSCSNLELIANLTIKGAGIGILPSSVVNSYMPTMLKTIPQMPSFHDEIYLIYRHENRELKALQTIIKAIKSLDL